MKSAVCGFGFPKILFQTNHAQTEKMYRKILSYAAPKNDEIILDGYSGVGTISLLLAREAKKFAGLKWFRKRCGMPGLMRN